MNQSVLTRVESQLIKRARAPPKGLLLHKCSQVLSVAQCGCCHGLVVLLRNDETGSSLVSVGLLLHF